MQERPFKYQTMHFHSVIKGGDTLFTPLRELYERQDVKTQERYGIELVAGFNWPYNEYIPTSWH
jgi:hypothetical protein